MPGRGSLAAGAVAKALVETGGVQSAEALYEAGYQLADSRSALTARTYLQASTEIFEALYAAHPEQVELKAGYAAGLCTVGRFTAARQLVDEVLELLPTHVYANQLKRYIEGQL